LPRAGDGGQGTWQRMREIMRSDWLLWAQGSFCVNENFLQFIVVIDDCTTLWIY
jgi:hypothetical protein